MAARGSSLTVVIRTNSLASSPCETNESVPSKRMGIRRGHLAEKLDAASIRARGTRVLGSSKRSSPSGRALKSIMTHVARAVAFITLLASASAEELKVPGALIELEFIASPSAAWRGVALRWIENSARAVSTYYGKFPVPRTRLRIASCPGTKPRGGTAFGWKGPLITISLGRDATAATLGDDWLLTHEMIHLALPSLPDQHHWLEEGLATYVEPIARARAAILTPEQAWAELVNGLHQGQPEVGDRGLDHTPTWGRTYWGGALFCLRADVAIRQRTGNRLGLEHALRGILAAGGSIDRD
jgi:hypothetical protein